MKGQIWTISEHGHLTHYKSCFERAICSLKYRYRAILMLINIAIYRMSIKAINFLIKINGRFWKLSMGK